MILLKSVQVTNFKSIVDSTVVPIDYDITVLVGQNESGKTAFLQALYQASPVYGIDKGFNTTLDYPRQNSGKIKSLHPDEKIKVIEFTYTITDSDAVEINKIFGAEVIKTGDFKWVEDYNGGITLTVESLVNEEQFVANQLKAYALSSLDKITASLLKSVKELLNFLKKTTLNDADKLKYHTLKARFENNQWAKPLGLEIYNKYLKIRRPKFFYFDEYMLLPAKTNLITLQNRVKESNSAETPKPLMPKEQVVLALLQMAGVSLDEMLKNKSYEEIKSNLEGLSNNITDQFLKYWKQNPHLEVVIDIADNADEEPPFNEGPNLHVRIKNTQQRVTLPFNQRSKGFVWFFSFLVWFDNIQTRAKERGNSNAPIILLLDEPGLNLHALAQYNLLSYIDSLAVKHQVIYTTHSPFMVHTDRLKQVRVVEDRYPHGTKVSNRLDGSDPASLFPLQAALGYTIAQSLFISKRNIIVEGITDLTYLRFFSNACEIAGKEALRPDITIMPVDGVDKIATFVALLGGNKLELAVLHDYAGKPDSRLESLVRGKILHEKDLLHYGIYRTPTGKRPTKTEQAAFIPTDVEDLFSVDLYLQLFCETFKEQLTGKQITEVDLPTGDRIVERLEKWLVINKVKLKPSDGFNHYAPANALVTSKILVDDLTLERFSNLFKDINKIFARRALTQ